MTSQDTTFRVFTPEQAAAYACGRGGSYPEPLYKTILDYHTGPRDTVLDVGTGPGKAIWDLLAYFDSAIGCDTSPQMIEQARRDAVAKDVHQRTFFTVSGAEDCARAVASAGMVSRKADLVTVAMAAHWFDLPKFYEQAAQVLRPGGTLAMFTCSSYYVHPSVPKAREVQALLIDLEDNVLGPYMTAGNQMSKCGYANLPLPWTIDAEKPLFDMVSFQRADWDKDGVPSSPALADGSPGPFLFTKLESIEDMEAGFSSASAVIRWRQAHPDQANTEEDPVKIFGRKLRSLGGDANGEIRLPVAPSCSLLLMRRL